jgi:FkbH-like protein
MKLIEAVDILRAAELHATSTREFFLACGFEPLHLRQFLSAHLHLAFPGDKIDLAVGIFGDLPGNLERARTANPAGAAVVVEWADLDPRLGLRQWAGWTPELLPDISRTVEFNSARIQGGLHLLAESCQVALCLPTLPLPPAGFAPGIRADGAEMELMATLATFGKWAASQPRIRLAGLERLDRLSPRAARRDVASDLFTGFPYSQPHADAVGGTLAGLLCEPAPKKGLITDLDGVFWRGILGEAGVQGVAWDLAGRAQVHGIYQQFLNSLASRGVLIGVASKNDPALVQEAFRRSGIGCPAERIYPFCVHWRPKSESVSEILKVWNISADAVVFVDDSPMELAEVQSAHPGIECQLFPQDPQKLLPMLEHLRDRFGNDAISREDLIRSESIRSAAAWREAESRPSELFEEFLSHAEARIAFSAGKPEAPSRRAFELVNKTNQFNLNGKRYTQAEWDNYLARPETFVASLEYRDKFGPLGLIAVALGRVERDVVRLDSWVMSCRAFSRRIEYQFMLLLFEKYAADAIELDYLETDRNGPLREFLAAFHPPQGGFRIARDEFERLSPPLSHFVEIIRQ